MAHSDIRDWNRIAATYAQAVNPAEDRIYLQLQPVLWDMLGDLRGRDVLDIGCGTGWLSYLLADAGASVVGVDGSAALLAYARQQAPTIRW